MSWFLNLIYICFLTLASPWLLWRYLASGKNRRGWTHKLFGSVKTRDSNARCIWLHAVSVGEVNLLTPILDRLLSDRPDLDIVISTTTETGFDLAQKKFAEHYVFFCPMDFTWGIKRVLKRLRPDLLVLAELELWPNLIRTTRKSGVPVAVVNARLSESSFNGYQKLGWLIGPTIRQLSLVAAQNQTYAQRFLELGCDPSNLVITGSVKFDGVQTDRRNPRTVKLAELAGLTPDDQVFVAGSTQLEEDLLAADVYLRLAESFPKMRLVLVPRHPERCAALLQQLRQRGIPTVQRSLLESKRKDDSNGRDGSPGDNQLKPVLVVDVIGELGAWWGRADAAYVGGSMGRRGGQNMIEPAAYGVPVSFGPNTENFRDIVAELLTSGAAVVVDDGKQLTTFVKQAFSSPHWATTIGQSAQNVVLNHVGASQRTADCLCGLIPKNPDDTGIAADEFKAA